MASNEGYYRAAERRIEWLTLVIGAAATLALAVRWGGRSAAGLALGALLAWGNYRWLKQGVTAMVKSSAAQADAAKPRVPKRVYVKFFGRFALLVAVVYVILSRSWLPLGPVLAGLFTLVAAVLLELLYELLRGARLAGPG